MKFALAVALGCAALLAHPSVFPGSVVIGEWKWTVPERLFQGVEQTYSPPSLDIEPGGTAILTWSDQPDPNEYRDATYVAWHLPESGWGRPLPLENVGTTAGYPVASLDGEARALLAFRGGAFPAEVISATQLPPQGSVGEMQVLGPEGDTGPLLAAMSESGNGFVVWIQYKEYRGLWARPYDPTFGWGPLSRLDSNETPAQVPLLAVDREGNAFVTWKSDWVLYARGYVSGSGWLQPVTISTSEEGWIRPYDLAMGSNGQGLVLWREDYHSRSDFRARWWDPGTGWSAPETVVTDIPFNALPSVVVSRTGRAMVVWDQETEIWASHFVPEAGWGEPLRVGGDNGTTGPRFAGPATLATGPGESVLAVWRQFVQDRWSVWASRFVPEAGWETPVILSSWNGPIFGLAGVPQGVAYNNGIATVAWIRTDGTGHGVWVSEFGPALGNGADGTATLLLAVVGAAVGVVSAAGLYFYFRGRARREREG